MWSNSEYIWPNAQRKWQMRTHLTYCVQIWPLLVGLTKCAAYLGKRAAQLAKCARIWPNAQLIWSNVAHLDKCTRIWPNERAFDQTLRIWSNAARFVNWSDAHAFGPMRCAIGQLRRLVKCALQWHSQLVTVCSRLLVGQCCQLSTVSNASEVFPGCVSHFCSHWTFVQLGS